VTTHLYGPTEVVTMSDGGREDEGSSLASERGPARVEAVTSLDKLDNRDAPRVDVWLNNGTGPRRR
jgi:hypothetical protein